MSSVFKVLASYLQLSPQRSFAMIWVTNERQTAYLVEVSGWDKNKDFFVEKTELQWREESAVRAKSAGHGAGGVYAVGTRLHEGVAAARIAPSCGASATFAIAEAPCRGECR
jgi:hypothetical protein